MYFRLTMWKHVYYLVIGWVEKSTENVSDHKTETRINSTDTLWCLTISKAQRSNVYTENALLPPWHYTEQCTAQGAEEKPIRKTPTLPYHRQIQDRPLTHIIDRDNRWFPSPIRESDSFHIIHPSNNSNDLIRSCKDNDIYSCFNALTY